MEKINVLIEQYVYNTATRELRWHCFLKKDIEDFPLDSTVGTLSDKTFNGIMRKVKICLTRNGYDLNNINFVIKEKKFNGHRRNKRQTKQKV